MKVNYNKLSDFTKGLVRYKAMLAGVSIERFLANADERYTSLVMDWRNPFPCTTTGVPFDYCVYDSHDEAKKNFMEECDLCIITESQALIIIDGMSYQLSLEWKKEHFDNMLAFSKPVATTTITIKDIDWDVDEEHEDELDLPDSVDVKVPKCFGNYEQEEYALDKLSDEYGYCIISYRCSHHVALFRK